MVYQDLHILLQWISVIVVLFVGGAVLSDIELANEIKNGEAYCSNKQKLLELDSGNASTYFQMEKDLEQGSNCIVPVCDSTNLGNYSTADTNWDLAGACFFILSTTTTIGYGTYVPATWEGKLFTAVFALCGILNFLMATSSTTRRIDDLLVAKFSSCSSPCLNWGLLAVFWVLIMSLFYSYLEGWDFGDAIYFSYITMSTIGFGDFAPTKTRNMVASYFFILGAVTIQQGFMGGLLKLLGHTSLEEEVQEEKDGGMCKYLSPIYCLKTILNKIPLILMWFLLFVYMLFGGLVFIALETNQGASINAAVNVAYNSIKTGEARSALTDHVSSSGNSSVADSSGSIMADLLNLANFQGTCPPPNVDNNPWQIIPASMFALTVFTTIGYGNVVPGTRFSKIFCIPYSLVGFWLFALTEARTAKLIGDWVTRQADQFGGAEGEKKGFCCCCKSILKIFPSTVTLVLSVASCIIMLVLSGALFTVTEGHGFFSALWFAYSSMTTIGYGDLTPSFHGWNFFIELFMLSIGLTSFSLSLHFIGEKSTDLLKTLMCVKDPGGAGTIGRALGATVKMKKAVV